MRNDRIFRFLLVGEFTSTRLLVRLNDGNVLNGKANKSQVLEQLASVRQWIGRLVRNRLVMGASFIRVAQERNPTRLVTKQYVLYRVTLFLAAITRLLLIGVLGARDWSFAAIVIKKGGASLSAWSWARRSCNSSR